MKRLLLLSIALLFTSNLNAQVQEVKTKKDTISIADTTRYYLLYNKTIDYLKILEGFRNKPYGGSNGHRTIGYGHQIDHTFTKHIITIEQGDSILRDDFQKSINLVGKETGFDKRNSPEKLLALASFAFNVGGEMFLRSTLLLSVRRKKSLNEIKIQFERWIHVKTTIKTVGEDGKPKTEIKSIINPNLKRMRDFEFNLYSGKIK